MLPDGRCDIILQYNVHSAKPPTPIITGPATQPYTVEYEEGDRWLGIRLRPNSGVNLWQQRIDRSADTVLRGQAALVLLPRLAHLQGSHLNLKSLAKVLETRKSFTPDQKLSVALDALHVSGGLMQIDTLATFVGYSSRQLNRKFRSNIGGSHESKLYAEVETGETVLAFAGYEAAEMNGLATLPNDLGGPASGWEICFITDDVTNAYHRAIDAGCTPVSTPSEKPWGQIVSYMRDINGCIVEIASPIDSAISNE